MQWLNHKLISPLCFCIADHQLGPINFLRLFRLLNEQKVHRPLKLNMDFLINPLAVKIIIPEKSDAALKMNNEALSKYHTILKVGSQSVEDKASMIHLTEPIDPHSFVRRKLIKQ